jgi:hypothetical protein
LERRLSHIADDRPNVQVELCRPESTRSRKN